jgi:hypothetical protein
MMAKRDKNERRFPNWEDLSDGGRRYVRRIKGRQSGYAYDVKIVDANEITIAIIQELFDDAGKLIAIHHKYPEDMGHQTIDSEAEE